MSCHQEVPFQNLTVGSSTTLYHQYWDPPCLNLSSLYSLFLPDIGDYARLISVIFPDQVAFLYCVKYPLNPLKSMSVS